MNKRMLLRVLTGVLLTVVTAAGLQAQRGQRPPGPPDQTQVKQMMEKLAAALSLTEDQKKQIAELFTAHFKEMGDLIKNSGEAEGPGEGGPAGRDHSEMEKLRKEFEGKVKALLTEEQKNKFAEFMKNHDPRSRQPMPKRND